MRLPWLLQRAYASESGNLDTSLGAVAQSARMATPHVWAIRRDWPAGDHEFVGARRSRDAALRLLESDRAFWRPGPLRPALSVARISQHDFVLHGRGRRGCKAPDCPTASTDQLAAGR
jgi:hypothetical protein